ncbi:LysR family transcriptional regulator [Pelagimonas varians]|uniref:HTH-type transcriptional regulator CynR n=1 Tax=Pelagimonas varians TaxID=696760 RepID=A0A238KTI9_9RHOB|nr:LysR family transcriptional regulator [Pelagimonas varians]PYG32604.1 LysR family transcriptional regulator [Pelagimonas varians]SMX46119.1 HTH-type transcriptional regulator CynR [Pelagimonas varians]
MRINYDFSDLEAFLAVKETGSFHAAAEQLNLSQSAITRRVQKLEQALDSTLFERTTRTVKPTLAAKRLQARAEAILQDAQETTRAMRDDSVAFDYQRGAIVTVAAVPTIVTTLLIPAMKTLRAESAKARIRILDGSANQVAEAVAGGDADFGLCSIPMLEPATVFEPLLDDQIMLAVPHGHELAELQFASWDALTATPLILPARGTGNRLLIDEAMAKSRRALHWTYEVGRSSTAMDLVVAGMGVALLPQSAIDHNRVASCAMPAPVITRSVGILSRIGQSDTSAVAATKDAIRAVI